MLELYINFLEHWKTHREVPEILHIQSRHQSDGASLSSTLALSSDDEEITDYRDKTENSDSAEDSDDESDNDDSPEELVTASNKFAALADND